MARGHEHGALGVSTDATFRSPVRLREVLENLPDLVLVLDRRGRIRYVNHGSPGASVLSLLGSQGLRHIAAEHRENCRKAFRCALRYRSLAKKGLLAFAELGEGYVVGKVIELEAVRKDGSEFPIELSVSPVQIQANGPWWAVAIIRDITQRKHTERSLREKEAHLLAAQEIQSRLWPESLETLPGYDIAGASYPAAFAGGDCFDFIPMGDGATGFVVGDVSGHGLGTALLTALTQAHLRSLAEMHTDLREILGRTNRCLAKETDHFVTLFFGCLTPESHTFRYVNAGHPPGYVLNRSGAVKRRLENTALPLAVSAETTFVEGEPVVLEPGDMIVLLTDGVYEAFSPTDELFGMDRTLELLRAHRRKSARQLIEILYGAVGEFAGGRELQDDITAVVIKVLPQRRPGRSQRSGPRRDGNPDPSRRSG